MGSRIGSAKNSFLFLIISLINLSSDLRLPCFAGIKTGKDLISFKMCLFFSLTLKIKSAPALLPLINSELLAESTETFTPRDLTAFTVSSK